MLARQKTRGSRRLKLSLAAVVAVGAAALLAWAYADVTARRKLAYQLTELMGLQASIGRVAFGWDGLTAFDVVLGNPTTPTLVIERLGLHASYRQLLSDQPQLKFVRFDRPTLQLYVADNGTLDWPFQISGDATTDLPDFAIKGGTVRISQPGSRSLAVKGADLDVTVRNEQFTCKGSVANLLDANWDVSAQYQLDDGMGNAQMEASRVLLRPSEIAKLPIVPAFIADLALHQAEGAIRIDVSRGRDDEPVRTAIQIDNATAALSTISDKLSNGSAQILVVDRSIRLRELSAHIGDARISGDASVDLQGVPYSGRFQASMQQLSDTQLRRVVPVPNFAQGIARGVASGQFTVDDAGRFEISIQGTGEVRDARVKGVPLDNVSLALDVRRFTIQPNGQYELEGDLNFEEVAIRDFPIKTLVQRVNENDEFAGLDALEGNFSLLGTAHVPIGSIDNMATWSGSGQWKSDSIRIQGWQATDCLAKVWLRDGTLQVNSISGRIAGRADTVEPANVSGTVTWPIAKSESATIDVRADRFPLTQVLAAIVESPEFEIEGSAQLAATFQVPLESWFDFGKWSGRFTATSSTITWDQLILSDVTLSSQLADGLIQIEELSAVGSNRGRVVARGVVPVDEHETIRIRFDGQHVGLTDLARLASQLNPAAVASSTPWIDKNPNGTVNIHGQWQARRLHLADPSRWSAKLTATTDEVIVWSRVVLGRVSTQFDLQRGKLHASAVGIINEDSSIEAEADVDLTSTKSYSATIKVGDSELASLTRDSKLQIPGGAATPRLPLSGTIGLEATVRGSLVEEAITARGTGHLRHVKIGGQDVSNVDFEFASRDGRLNRLQVKGQAFRGTVDVIADLASSSPTERHLSFRATNWDTREIRRLFKSAIPGPLQLAGRLNAHGQIQLGSDLEQATGTAQLTGMTMRVADIAISEIVADLAVEAKQIDLQIAGKALNGDLSATARTRWDNWGDDASNKLPLNLTLRGAQLEQLSNQSRRYAKMRTLTGSVDVQLDLQILIPSGAVSGSGDVAIQQVSWDRKRLTRLAEAKLVIDDPLLRLRDVSIDLGQGAISGWLDLSLSGKEEGRYDLDIRRLDVARVLQFSSLPAAEAKGTVTGRVAGTIGRHIRGRARVAVDRLSVASVTASSLRLPINFMIRRDDFSGQLYLRNATAQLADGRLVADGSIASGRRRSVDLKVQLSKLDSGQLIQQLAGTKGYGQGRLSGTIELAGRGIRTIRDLDGRFRGKLEDSQAMQLPVLNDLARFANVGTVARGSFDSEEVKLQLDNGIVSTPGLVFKSDRAELFVKGHVDINQRLDLDIAMQTGNITPDFGLLGLIESPIGRVTVPGVSTAVQALDYLSNRVIYLHAGGTIRSPHFRLRTDRFLQDALLRYYLPTSQYDQILQNR